MKRRLLFAPLLTLALACDRTPPRPLEVTDAEPELTVAPESSHDAAPVVADVPFADLVRQGRWQEAERAILALAEAERKKPEMRLLLAKVQLSLGKAEEALASSEGLESELPALLDRVTALRADAAWRAGRAAEAAALFDRMGPAYAERAAEAYARNGDAEGVRKAVAKADVSSGSGKAKRKREAALRSLRLRFEDEHKALEDARWLATVGAAEPGGDEGMRYLREKQIRLSFPELEARGKALAEAGKVSEAKEVAHQVEQGGKPEHHTLACFMRATALFHSRASYKEAHQAFVQCEKVARQPEEKAESAFLAARSLLRADHDDEAIVAFERMLERYPKSNKAAEARALIARTHLLHGRFDKAHELYEAWLGQVKGSSIADEFAHYRPFAALLSGHAGKARTLFEERMSHRDSSEARMSTLFSAVAALQNGDPTTGKSRLRNLYEKSPWSLAGQFAKLRLQKLGETPPPLRFEADVPAPPPVVATLPEGASLLHALGLDDDAEQYLEPREGLVAAASHGRETEALCAAYATLGRARRPYRMTSRMPQQYLDHKPVGGARWVWQCMYPSPYPTEVSAQAEKHKVPPGLVYAVMRTESGFDPEALSPVGAFGLMQLMPQTAERLERGAHFREPAKNIELGVRHLAENHATEGSWPLAVMGYNGSPEAVARWRKRLPELPLDVFTATIPLLETRNYVVKVLEVWARYQVLAAPEQEPALDLELPTARR